jgi:hypothetical protein
MTAPVITDSLAGIVLALTPIQRWEAMRRFDTGFMTERWFILTAGAAIVILTVVLFVVSLQRAAQERKVSDRVFGEYAQKRGLSRRERQTLWRIALKGGLKKAEAIFTMGSAFDRGATKMIEKSLEQKQTAEEGRQLKSELSFLREKLGFQNRLAPSSGAAAKSKKLSSRQIPVGKKLQITRRMVHDQGDIESTVIENNDMELVVKFTTPVKVTPGEFWRVHYYFGTSVWEFDTSVAACHGQILVLNHSDDVRYINRRRFLRVPVNKPAFIARFPFARMVAGDSGDSNVASGGTWGLPKFVPAVITELAGPGLRIEAPLEMKVGERVLVVFRLDEGKDKDAVLQKDAKTPTSRIVEDIGEVRHTKVIQKGLSIAVELTGLSDSDVNELIRATNAASVRTGAKGQGASGAVNAEGSVPEAAVVQGGSVL